MKLFFTHSFIKDYQSLLQTIQQAAAKKLGLFLANPRHPSLQIKKMNDPRGIWEGRATKDYRFTFQMEGDRCLMGRIGTHDTLKKP